MASMVANLLLGRLPSYTRKSRHFQLLRRYANPVKLSNMARVELSRLRGDIVVKGFPYVYTIDTGNLCNLRCPLCPTGYQGLERPQALMALDSFQIILEKIRPYAIEAILHNWGEPFLNPQILSMVRAAHAAGVGTTISSNLNLVHRGSDFLEEVVASGLDHLTVSIDGTTEDVYQKYRKGGVLEDVLTNLKTLLQHRRNARRSTPIVEWQFLVMKHNEHQMDDAQRMADEIGVDRLRFTGAGMPFDDLANLTKADEWLSELPEYRSYAPDRILERGYLHDERCFYLYRAMTANPRGEVSPCCAVHHAQWDFGNLLESELSEVWNNEHYRSSRALFSRKSYDSGMETVCHRCPLFKYETKGGPHASVPSRA